MKKILIILPLYNDWKSTEFLLQKINNFFKKNNIYIQILIVNDNSSEKSSLQKKKFSKIKKIEILNLKKNVGSQKAIFVGLKWVLKKKIKCTIIVMDSDGEDDYSKIKVLAKKAEKSGTVVFARRTGRTENILLKFLNQIRIIITFILTGKYLNVGNYSAFNSSLLEKIISNNNLSIAYCSGIIKNLITVESYGIKKNKRYFGNSKVNIIFILKHSLNLISVFYKEVFFRSLILAIGFIFFYNNAVFEILFLFTILNFIIYLSYFFNIQINKDLHKNIRGVSKLK